MKYIKYSKYKIFILYVCVTKATIKTVRRKALVAKMDYFEDWSKFQIDQFLCNSRFLFQG